MSKKKQPQIAQRTAPRHRRPNNECTDPRSEYYVPNDAANRVQQTTPQKPAEVRRRTLLEVSQEVEEGEAEAKWRQRLREDQERGEGTTTCPRCGMTPEQALHTNQPPAMVVGPAKVRCTCSSEVIDVGALREEQRGKREREAQMIRECRLADEHRGTPGSGSSGSRRRRDKPRAKLEVRWEQEAPLSNGRGDEDIVTCQRLELAERKDINLSQETKCRLGEWAKAESRLRNRKVAMADGIRRAMRAQIATLGEVSRLEHGGEKRSLQVMLYPSELHLLEEVAKAKGVERNEVIEACLISWLED